MAKSAAPVCTYCDRQLCSSTSPFHTAATLDHALPKSRNGLVTVPCCRQCNALKADLLPARWATFMAFNPRWWGRFRTHQQVLASLRAIDRAAEARLGIAAEDRPRG